MGKFFTRLCELFCPVKSVRKQMRARRKLTKLQSCNRIEIAPEDLMRVQLSVNGCNNVVRIGRLKSGSGRVIVMVHGSDNEIIIGDGCVVGWGAVVSRLFPESHCVLAGNPARIVKRGVTWDANGAKHGYIDNEF